VWSNGGEADLVDDDQVVAADLFDGSSDGVVGDGAPEVFDELDGGEVADPVAGGDGGLAEPDQVVGFAGSGGADETEVVGPGDPVERDEVVVTRCGDGGLVEVELVEGLVDGEPCCGPAGAAVRVVAGGDLEIDEDAQGLFGRPTLCLGGEQHVGGLAADRGQLQSFQPGLEVVG
jgi:hypothetical protein